MTMSIEWSVQLCLCFREVTEDKICRFKRALNHTQSRSCSNFTQMLFSLEFKVKQFSVSVHLLVLPCCQRCYERMKPFSQQIFHCTLHSTPILLKGITGIFSSQGELSLILPSSKCRRQDQSFHDAHCCNSARSFQIQQNLAEFHNNFSTISFLTSLFIPNRIWGGLRVPGAIVCYFGNSLGTPELSFVTFLTVFVRSLKVAEGKR